MSIRERLAAVRGRSNGDRVTADDTVGLEGETMSETEEQTDAQMAAAPPTETEGVDDWLDPGPNELDAALKPLLDLEERVEAMEQRAAAADAEAEALEDERYTACCKADQLEAESIIADTDTARAAAREMGEHVTKFAADRDRARRQAAVLTDEARRLADGLHGLRERAHKAAREAYAWRLAEAEEHLAEALAACLGPALLLREWRYRGARTAQLGAVEADRLRQLDEIIDRARKAGGDDEDVKQSLEAARLNGLKQYTVSRTTDDQHAPVLDVPDHLRDRHRRRRDAERTAHEQEKALQSLEATRNNFRYGRASNYDIEDAEAACKRVGVAIPEWQPRQPSVP